MQLACGPGQVTALILYFAVGGAWAKGTRAGKSQGAVAQSV